MTETGTIITVAMNPAIDRVIRVDNFALGAHQVGREVRRAPGGKGVNVSRVLAALGVENIITGFVGEENRSQFAPALEEPLAGDEFFTLPGRTRENVTIADPVAQQETHIREPGLAVDRDSLARLGKKLARIARQDSIVVFSGSLPPGVGPGDLAELVRVCQAGGARVAVDTSGENLRALASKLLWLAKPNASELAEFLGHELPDLSDQLVAAQKLTSRVENVLFTRGAEGAYLFTPHLALQARCGVGSERVRNTVGCGDALLGAFLAGIHRGLIASDAFRDAVACAAASAASIGPAEFDPLLYEALRDDVELTEL